MGRAGARPRPIFAGADDSVRVFIDGNLVIERNVSLGFETRAAATTLSAGPHQILVEYMHSGRRTSLEVLWAPAGQTPRPIPPEALFVGVPSAKPDREGPVWGRVAELARWAWIAFGAVALPFLLLPVARAGRRWIASGAPQGVVRRTLSSAAHWQAQYAAPAFWLASCAAILRIAGTRMPALNPQTLWADDVTVACLAKLDSFWTAVE